MLFGKRRWSTGVAREAGMEPQAGSGKAVIDLLTISAKKAQRMVRGAGPRGEMDDLDFVMMAARALPHDTAAIARIEKALSLPQGEGARMLAEVAAAAVRFYQDEGRELGAPRPGREREPWKAPG